MTRQERIDMLVEILSIDSAGANEEQVAACLLAHLEKAGITGEFVCYAPGRKNLVAEWGDTGPVLALSGHMDVVPAGDMALWDTEPFKPVEKDGRIYARGATDMKSGLAAMVIAMIELAEEKADLSGRVRLLATVGEEEGLLGARLLTKKGCAGDVDALIVGEPTGHRIVYAQKGICTIAVTSRGESAHSSMPQRGVNAIDNLVVFYNLINKELAGLTGENAVLGKLVYCNSIIQGGRQANVVPDTATLTINLRTVPEAGNEQVISLFTDVISRLNERVEGMRLAMSVQQNDPPVFSDPHARLAKTAQAEAQKLLGKELPLLGAPGATDAAAFVHGNKAMQVIVFGPGSDTMHQVNEYVQTQNYLEMIDLYKNIVRAYLKR